MVRGSIEGGRGGISRGATFSVSILRPALEEARETVCRPPGVPEELFPMEEPGRETEPGSFGVVGRRTLCQSVSQGPNQRRKRRGGHTHE